MNAKVKLQSCIVECDYEYKLRMIYSLHKMFNLGLLPFSFRAENLDWVQNKVIDFLESDELGYKLCIHQRDFVPGVIIMENICTAIQHSRRLIAVVTR